MAVDQALLESVQSGAPPLIRLYQWSPACLSFGRNQVVAGHYDQGAAIHNGIDFIRRPTGGLAVMHDRELTYSVVAPVDLFGGARAAYEWVNRVLVSALGQIGVPASLAAAGARTPGVASMNPCFDQPASGEVIAGGGKLIGSAQRCEKRTLLQHGSLLLDGNQSVVASYLRESEGRPQGGLPVGVSLRSILGEVPDMAVLVAAMVSAFESALGTRLAPGGLTEMERARAAVLEEQYDSAEWTWRR